MALPYFAWLAFLIGVPLTMGFRGRRLADAALFFGGCFLLAILSPVAWTYERVTEFDEIIVIAGMGFYAAVAGGAWAIGLGASKLFDWVRSRRNRQGD